MSARGLVSINVRVEISIVSLSQVLFDVVEVVSIDIVEVVSIDVVEVVLIDVARFSLRIVHSKRTGRHVPERQEIFLYK